MGKRAIMRFGSDNEPPEPPVLSFAKAKRRVFVTGLRKLPPWLGPAALICDDAALTHLGQQIGNLACLLLLIQGVAQRWTQDRFNIAPIRRR